MSYKSFDYFGKIATTLEDPLSISGRHGEDEDVFDNITGDVSFKLDLEDGCRLLEIGCGCGSLLRRVYVDGLGLVGIDHENFAKWFIPTSFDPCKGIRFVPGNFLDVDTKSLGTFDKILIYSVIHYLSDYSEVLKFLNKALDLLEPWGMMLVGDIPNISMKKRFFKTDLGRDMLCKRQANFEFITDTDRVAFDDERILSLVSWFRAKENNAWIIPQDIYLGLPYCYTREDILVQKLA